MQWSSVWRSDAKILVQVALQILPHQAVTQVLQLLAVLQILQAALPLQVTHPVVLQAASHHQVAAPLLAVLPQPYLVLH